MARKFLVAEVCLALLCGALSTSADDVVGVVRVDAPSGVAVEVAMPFEPLSSVRIADFLSGGFVGDGGEGADRLWQVSSRDGFVGLNLLSWGYPSVITSFPELPKGVDGPMDVEGRPLPVAALPWWSAFWVTNANASVVRLERPRPYDVPS